MALHHRRIKTNTVPTLFNIMGFIIFLLIVVGIGYLWLSRDPKWLRDLYEGKSAEQKQVIRYFLAEGCLARTMSDDQYDEIVRGVATSKDFKQQALDKFGLDESQVQEIPPVHFEGYVFEKAYAKKGKDSLWRSSKYQITWIFFSDTQVYMYQYTFNTDENTKRETADEFFYKDIVNASHSTSTDEVVDYDKSGNKKITNVESTKFVLVVPGDKMWAAMQQSEENENVVKAMKNKLREKKAQ